MAIYLLASEPQATPAEPIEFKLRPLLPSLRKIEKVEQAASEIGSGHEKAFLIFVSPPLMGSSLDNFIGVAKKYRDRIFFILVTTDISAADYKRVVQTGGADWVSSGTSLSEIPEIIKRQLGPGETVKVEASAPVEKPRVISFLPARGGVGNTTVALEAALQIKHVDKGRTRRVCYIDLDFQTSHVCDFLDIEPRLQISELIEEPDRMDEQLLELFVSRYESRLDVFAAPPSKLDPCDVGTEALDVFFEQVVKRYDYIILDLPVAWYEWTAPTLGHSDGILVTANNTVPCLRQLRSTLDEVARTKAATSQLGIIINRVEDGLFGRVKRRQHVDRVVRDETVFFVHEDAEAVNRINRGVPAKSGKFAKEFIPIASFCLPVRAPAKKG